MGRSVFITGGSRSGKSAFGEQLAQQHPGPLLYVATAAALDTEMARRIEAHRNRRDARWTTLEEPLQLVERLPEACRGKSALLLDCVTLWVSNVFFHHREGGEAVLAQADRFCELLPRLELPVFLVSNELGMGIVPENALARKFRDLAGSVNQRLAGACDEAYLVVSGLPLKLK